MNVFGVSSSLCRSVIAVMGILQWQGHGGCGEDIDNGEKLDFVIGIQTACTYRYNYPGKRLPSSTDNYFTLYSLTSSHASIFNPRFMDERQTRFSSILPSAFWQFGSCIPGEGLALYI